ncbi:hypothetical protein LCGC14_1153070 [marine sediment metagenome]|uniref:Uncharacterized protein n=1 Tax=marine sediment metagenome TaxID=412755 RepID=A0A0F9Q0F8_9ZZZZ
MDNDQTFIYGYLEVGSDTALCPFCTQVVYGEGLNLALGQGMIEAIRHGHAGMLKETLYCIKCAQSILAPAKIQPEKLEVFREFVNRTDLGKEL